jgi:hypothetical protein
MTDFETGGTTQDEQQEKRTRRRRGELRLGNVLIWGTEEGTGKRICLDYRPIEWLQLIGAYIVLYIFFAGFFTLLLWIFMRIQGFA